MRMRKGGFLLLAMLPAFGLVACGPSPAPSAPQPTSKAAEAPPAAKAKPVERYEIPLGNIPDAEASFARNFYFILDSSGSMSESPGKAKPGEKAFNSKIEGAKWAIEEFLKKVPDDVNLGLWVFDNYSSGEKLPLGANNRDNFLKQVKAAVPGNRTPLIGAIEMGTKSLVKQYQKQLGYGEYRLIVVTDGAQTDGDDNALEAAVMDATRYGMPIYTIGLCLNGAHPLRKLSVSYRAANSIEELKEGLEDVTSELPDFDAKEFGEP